MEKTDLTLTPISYEDFFNHKSKAYNSSTWEHYCKDFCSQEDVKLYVVSPDKLHSYPRFYKTYQISEGFGIFAEFSPFHGGLSSNGFVKVQIIDNVVYTEMFEDRTGAKGRAENIRENRKMFRNLNKNIFVCNSL